MYLMKIGNGIALENRDKLCLQLWTRNFCTQNVLCMNLNIYSLTDS